MKKILTITSIISFFAASSALAKTEGSYLELDLLRANSAHKYASNNANASNYPKFSDSSAGFGLGYKYAFSFDKLSIAPGIFFDKFSTKATDKDGDNVMINNRYGLKLDIGYDVTDKVMAYFTNGFASAAYKVNWNSVESKTSGSKVGYFFGAGFAYHLTNNVTLNAEYNLQNFNAPTPNFGGINKAKTSIGVAKVGVAYHF